jgi:hypothetical protein
MNLYIHEIAIHTEHNVDDFRPGVMAMEDIRKGPEFLTASHVEALTLVLQSSQHVLDSYLAFDLNVARNLPNLCIVWDTYAMVVLIKLYWMVQSPGSHHGPLFRQDLKVDYYLDAMTHRLSEVAAQRKSPCAEAFGFIFQKLRMWHMHRGGRFSEDERGSEGAEQQGAHATSMFSSVPNTFESTKTSSQDQSRPPLAGGRGVWNSEDVGSNPVIYDNFGTSNLNAAFEAQSYGNTNWDQFNFTAEEMNTFDVYMNNSGWMGHLL